MKRFACVAAVLAVINLAGQAQSAERIFQSSAYYPAVITDVTQNVASVLKPAMEVDTAEVLRRGNLVEQVGTAIADGPTASFGEAMNPPADDSQKWFISVISTPGCPACARLKADWRAKPELLCWADPNNYKGSWAHYNQYDYGDKTQDWRWSDIQIGAFPTVLVQPPLNGTYGNPKTVVRKIVGYDGDAVALSKKIRDGIVKYCETIPPRRERQSLEALAGEGKGAMDTGSKVAPPWTPNPKLDPPPAPPTPQPYYQPIAPVPQYPFDVPPSGPGGPTTPAPATLEDLKAALPQASPEFLLDQISKKATLTQALTAYVAQQKPATPATVDPAKTVKTSIEELKKALPDATIGFLIEQWKKGATVDETIATWHTMTGTQGTPAAATTPASSNPLNHPAVWGAGGAGLLLLLPKLLSMFRAYWLGTGHQAFLNDAQFKDLKDFLTPKAPPAPPAAPTT